MAMSEERLNALEEDARDVAEDDEASGLARQRAAEMRADGVQPFV